MKKLLALVFLSMFMALPATAIDPICDPNDPAFGKVHDPALGSYIRPNRDVHFCSALVPENPGFDHDMVCTVSVDGSPYAQATRKQGEEIIVSNPSVGPGNMELVCTIDGVDETGNPIVYAGLTTQAFYQPTPAIEAPTPLEN